MPRIRPSLAVLLVLAAAAPGCGTSEPPPTIDLESPIKVPAAPTANKVEAVKPGR